jgi:hypothetical protein
VFARWYSGDSGDFAFVHTAFTDGTTAFIAVPDWRRPHEFLIADDVYGSSLYWMRNELVFTLTVYQPSRFGLVDFGMLAEIAESIR